MSEAAAAPSFAALAGALANAFDGLSSRRVLLFGGKGGVGKTTLASLAALHLSKSSPVILFSTDPASNLRDLFESSERTPENLRVETLDAAALWKAFLDENLERFVELGDRGTYLDRDEIQRLFELSVPGIDELMGWMRIGEIAEREREALLIVDTAPTGHTLRLLTSSTHFGALSNALEEMQAKHRALVSQLSRRAPADPMDDYLRELRARFESYRELLSDRERSAFVPVLLAEPWVVAQTRRLVDEVRGGGIDVPLAILNQTRHGCDCPSCREAAKREREAAASLDLPIVPAPRACVPLGSASALERALAGEDVRASEAAAVKVEVQPLRIPGAARLLFFAGKGGVGKTSSACSVALQLAARSPDRRFVLVSVDPAHSVRDVFETASPPPNLAVETIDTRRRWESLRARFGEQIERAIRSLTAPNVRISHDAEVLQELVEIAPPGADEIFAIMRLADLLADPAVERIVVDTAPTGHFLRLLELPKTAGEWVREMMRLLLRYKELVQPGVLGEELLEASKALKRIDAALASEQTAVTIVTRAERLVALETARLREELERRGVPVAATIVNALTPESDCSCERSRRAAEMEVVAGIVGHAVVVDRRSEPPVGLDALRSLIPLE
ncbi:MAG TPA: TRC40/GET3/ArsA family transport-energizing ATPase [Thermoanaerobaculia bacterium]|nr:TRC40/GET3/ArsA family transport-energizing ATPase [Thermoanaerobaculia bacterium]